MAKSSRASTRKANNQRLVSKVFGPVEDERQQRLAAKLLEIASQPKPVPEKEMKDADEAEETEQKTAGKPKASDSKATLFPNRLQSSSCRDAQGFLSNCFADHIAFALEMDVDTTAKSSKVKKGKTIVKRRGKRSNIVFPKFGDKKAIRKKTK